MIKFQRVVVRAGEFWQLIWLVFFRKLKKLQSYFHPGCRYLLAVLCVVRTQPVPLPFSGYWRKNGKKGFTLIELMMVIAIIGTLSAIAIPNYLSYRERANYARTIQTMRMMDREITNFNIDHGRFPDSLAEAGLDHLRDPWGNPYQYLNIETSKGNGKRRKKNATVPINNDFDLYSMGPDGKSIEPLTAKHSRDDIVRANNGAFLGKASNY